MNLRSDMRLPDDFVSMKRDPTKREIRMIKHYGRNYEPALRPTDIKPGPAGWCFDISMIEAMNSNGKYEYVEGIARRNDETGWTLHAWLTDGVYAFDPTWDYFEDGKRLPFPGKYIGIEIPIMTVMLFVKTTEFQGVIPNRHRYPHALQSVIDRLEGERAKTRKH